MNAKAGCEMSGTKVSELGVYFLVNVLAARVLRRKIEWKTANHSGVTMPH